MEDINYSSLLAGWYATPLSLDEAHELMREVQQRHKKSVIEGTPCLLCEIEEMAAAFWSGKSVKTSLELAVRTEKNPARAALLQLAYGQLLLSCKRENAFEYLDRGLHQAADYFDPSDYFQVMNRHELLSGLPLFAEGRPPADLATLENEARILARLKQGQPRLTGNFGSTPLR